MKKQVLSSVIGNFIEDRKAIYSSPFHKGDGFFAFSGNEAAKWDVPIPKEAAEALTFSQLSAARYMGAAHAFFTTCGAKTALLSLLQCFSAEDTLLLLRSCSSSVFDAVTNCPAKAIVVQSSASPFPEASQLECLVSEYHAKAILVTSPDIYGRCADLPALAQAAHNQNALLVVDGSLGASIPYACVGSSNPYASADIWYHDLSFSLRGMVQCGCIFLNQCSIHSDQLQFHLDCLLPEAPSALLLAAADWALYMSQHTDWISYRTRFFALCSSLTGIPGINVHSREKTVSGLLCIDVSNRGITGFEASQYLIKDGLSIQFADRKHIVLLLSPYDDPTWDNLIIEKISQLPIKTCHILDLADGNSSQHDVIFPSCHDIVRVSLKNCIGKIAAKAVSLDTYGPVLLVPGEIITEAAITGLLTLLSEGVHVIGIQNETIALLPEDTI